MIKVPNLTPKEILEVKRKKLLGLTYAKLKRDYNIAYNDIKKIMILFAECEFEKDIEDKLKIINERNKIKTIRDRKVEYQKYKDYYMKYNDKRRGVPLYRHTETAA